MIKTREIDEFTVEEAERLVRESVKRDGYEFFMLVNKSACLFRNGDGQFGIVLGREDGIQPAPGVSFAWVLLRAGTTLYDVDGIRID